MYTTSITTSDQTDPSSVIAVLRSILPNRQLLFREALQVAELQATRLLQLCSVHEPPVPSSVVTSLPHITIEYAINMPCSGVTDWDVHRQSWVITLNRLEPATRRRLTLLHEYKHIIDHGHIGLLPTPSPRNYSLSATEYVADYFAGCVLVPTILLRRAWGQGIQRIDELARLFDVSYQAMQVRLHQTQLDSSDDRSTPSRKHFSKANNRNVHDQDGATQFSHEKAC